MTERTAISTFPPATSSWDYWRQWQRFLATTRQRRLIWWPVPPDLAVDLPPIERLFSGPHYWVGEHDSHLLKDRYHCLTLQQARTQLGRELGTVVIDARHRFNADVFGAIIGALVGGGVLILLTPDPLPGHGFYGGLAALLTQHPAVIRRPFTPTETAWPLPPECSTSFAEAPPSVQTTTDDAFCPAVNTASAATWHFLEQQTATDDQRGVLQRLQHVSERSITVITAPRGRGKSTVLGLALAGWLAHGPGHKFWLTAPRLAAVDTLLAVVAEYCPEGRRTATGVMLGERQLEFLAPDVVTERLAQCFNAHPSMLIVDEAAALPIMFLERWSAGCPQLVLASTLDGYEGSAQGFEHYLRRCRQRAGTMAYRQLELRQPIRWSAADPLEALTRSLLQLDACPAVLPEDLATRVPTVERLKASRLGAEPILLHQVFGLLLQAHYRTTPSDLQTLLDHPSLSLWVLRMVDSRGDGPVIAVLMAFDEGGLERPLAEAVAAGYRRPAGHLLPQALALQSGWHEVAERQWRRITRIAVHPDCQRRGWGSSLLTSVIEQSQRDGIDFIGASFGGTLSTLAFWQHHDFATLRVGMKRDTVTGQHAFMAAYPCQPSPLWQRLKASFWSLFPTQLSFELNELSSALVGALLLEAMTPCPHHEHSVAVRAALERFGRDRAPLATVRPCLQHALLHHGRYLSDEQRRVMAGIILQGRTNEWAVKQLPQLTGKRAVMDWLRATVAQWPLDSAC